MDGMSNMLTLPHLSHVTRMHAATATRLGKDCKGKTIQAVSVTCVPTWTSEIGPSPRARCCTA